MNFWSSRLRMCRLPVVNLLEGSHCDREAYREENMVNDGDLEAEKYRYCYKVVGRLGASFTEWWEEKSYGMPSEFMVGALRDADCADVTEKNYKHHSVVTAEMMGAKLRIKLEKLQTNMLVKANDKAWNFEFLWEVVPFDDGITPPNHILDGGRFDLMSGNCDQFLDWVASGKLAGIPWLGKLKTDGI